MSWVYFTDWLDDDQTITANQLHELYDAVRERIDAAWWEVNSTRFSASKSSGMLTNKIWIKGVSGGTLANPIYAATGSPSTTEVARDLRSALNSVAPSYLIEPLATGTFTSYVAFHTSTTLATAALAILAAAGHATTTADVSNDDALGLNTARRWNYVRAQVMALNYVGISFLNTLTGLNSVRRVAYGKDDTFATAVSLAQSATTPGGAYSGITSTTYAVSGTNAGIAAQTAYDADVNAQRIVVNGKVRALSIMAGASVAWWAEVKKAATGQPDPTIVPDFTAVVSDGAEVTFAATPRTDFSEARLMPTLTFGSDSTLTLAVYPEGWPWPGYDNPTQAASAVSWGSAFEQVNNAVSLMPIIGVKPVFTHPS